MVISIVLVQGLEQILPAGMPFLLTTPMIAQYAAIFIVISILGTLISLYQVLKVDALEAIGRDVMTSLLKLDKVSKVYGEGNTEVTALHSISLDVKAGEFIGIVGPSGSGKVRYYQSRALLSPSKGIFTFVSKILRSYQKRK